MLGQVNEKKELIYFASGLRLQGIDNQAQMHATADAAIKAGVSIWTVDARGLVAQAPLQAMRPKDRRATEGVYTGVAAQAVCGNFQHIAGHSLRRSPVIRAARRSWITTTVTRGIVRAQQAISDYYILAYYTTNTDPNGKFRRIRISLAQNQEAKLDYRQGYYAEKEFSKFTGGDRERQLGGRADAG